MVCTIEGFKAEVDKIRDESDIDSLCVRWLRTYCSDVGANGTYAEKLLAVAAEMMGIYA